MERMQRGKAPLHAPFVIPAEAGIPNVTVSTKTPLNPLATFLGELGNTPQTLGTILLHLGRPH